MSLASKYTLTLLLISSLSVSVFSQSNKTFCGNDLEYCDGQKAFNNGNVYSGELSYGVPMGQGLMKFATGDEYLGGFENGKMHGKGAILLANGDSYHGEWSNGEAEGQGTYKKSDGSGFTGKFIRGKRQGEGIVTWKTGDTLKGNWTDDKLNGKAIFEFANGDKLETIWNDGHMKVKCRYKKDGGQYIIGSLSTIYMTVDLEDDFAEVKNKLLTNLQMAWISSAMEFEANEDLDMAVDFLMAAQKFGPNDSDYNTVIAQRLKSIDNRKNNTGWAQLPTK